MTDRNEALRLADEWEPRSYEVSSMLRQQAERIAELEAENGKLRDGLAKGLSEKTMLTELAMRNGGLYAGIEGGAAAVLASAFAEQFTSSGGVNYVEVSFMHPATGPICVTLQRVQGKTPHQLRREAEAERDQLRAEVERLRADAERYEWLREHSYVEVTCKSSRDPSWTPQHLDTAIDIARKEAT